jgi:hypothetical protein
MAETRRKFDVDFREGAVRLVRETGKPIAQVARDLGSTRARWGTGSTPISAAAVMGPGRWMRMSERSWRGCAANALSWRWSAMCSSAVWPSGSRTRWGGSGGRPDRRPEGRSPHPGRGGLPGAGGVPVVVLQVARRTLPPRAPRRERLKAEVKRLFEEHEGKRGSPMITADLRDAGWRVSENTVAALMREQHLAARRKRRRRSATRPGRGRWRAPDLVRRQFPAARLNHKWYGDGTEIPTDVGKLYLTSVMEAASRRILGFTLSGHHDAAAAYGALAMAIAVRGGQVPGVIMHTDQGSEGIHRPGLPGGLPAGGHRPVDGAARLRAGQDVGFILHLLVLLGCELAW